MKIDDDPFDLAKLRLPPEQVQTTTRTPRRIEKRRQQFTMLPGSWYDKLSDMPCRLVLAAPALEKQRRADQAGQWDVEVRRRNPVGQGAGTRGFGKTWPDCG